MPNVLYAIPYIIALVAIYFKYQQDFSGFQTIRILFSQKIIQYLIVIYFIFRASTILKAPALNPN